MISYFGVADYYWTSFNNFLTANASLMPALAPKSLSFGQKCASYTFDSSLGLSTSTLLLAASDTIVIGAGCSRSGRPITPNLSTLPV